ncbi:MAG: VWA domain-containing protein [Defluviicoccus sp.]
MTAPDDELILYGVFETLLQRRVPLGVPDYLDALRALRLGLGLPPPVLSTEAAVPAARDRLRWLCKALWARNDDERRLLDAIFDAIPPPAPEEIEPLATEMERIGRQRLPWWRRLWDALRPEGLTTSRSRPPPDADIDQPRIAVAFESPRQAGGIPLPRLFEPTPDSETFVLRPQTVVSQRTLTILWRRFRAMMRSGAKTEIDIDATLTARCRQGVLARPAMRAPRRNRARLLILADVSASMAPWRPFLDVLAGSLALGRLQQASIYYFSNLPRRAVFARADLTLPSPLEEVFNRYRSAGLLIISDAGAARGLFSPRRARETEDFLAETRRAMAPRSVVWLNPMPRDRWQGSSAGALAQQRLSVVLPLNGASLIRAVDVLRGAKRA